MQAEHGVAVARILAADVEYAVARLEVDGGQEDGRTTSLTGSLYDGVAVGIELLAVKMAVGVDVVQVES
jgi:hypothetical protein